MSQCLISANCFPIISLLFNFYLVNTNHSNSLSSFYCFTRFIFPLLIIFEIFLYIIFTLLLVEKYANKVIARERNIVKSPIGKEQKTTFSKNSVKCRAQKNFNVKYSRSLSYWLKFLFLLKPLFDYALSTLDTRPNTSNT